MLKRSSLATAWIVWGLAATFYCYGYLLRILPSVMTDYLLNSFAISGLTLGNLAAAYYYTYVPAQLPAGILMDRTSIRKVLTTACLMSTIGLYGFTSNHLTIAYGARLLTGLGSSMAFIGVMKLTTLYFPPSYFSLITGLTTSLGMLGAMLGNLTLVRLLNNLGTQATLLSIAFSGLLLALGLYIVLPELGTSAPSEPYSHSAVVSLLKDSRIWASGFVGCALLLSLTAFSEMWGITYLMTQYGLSQAIAARYNALVFAGWAIGSPLMGYIGSRFYTNELPRFLTINAIAGALCFSLMLYTPTIISSYVGLLLTLFGLFSSSQIVVFTLVRDAYPRQVAGMAFALTNLVMMLGGGLSQPIVGYMLDASSSKVGSLHHFSPESFVFAFSIIPIAFVLAAFVSSYRLNSKK